MKLYRLDRLLGPAVVLTLLSCLPVVAQPPSSMNSPVLDAADLALYGAVFELIESGEPGSGLEKARQGSNSLATKIADWVDLSRRDTERPFDEIDAFLRSNPTWPRRYQLFRNAELTLPGDWTAAEILGWFGQRPPITGIGALRYCQALAKLGRSSDLKDIAALLWVSVDFEPKDETTFHARFRGHLTPDTERKRLERLLWDRRTAAARRQLKRVDAGQAALARARIALYDSRPGVDAAIKRVPEDLRNDEGLLYERAAWRKRRNRFEGVVELLQKAPTQGEHLASWWKFRKWATWRALDRSDWQAAYDLSRRHGMSEGLGFAEGEWLAGWISLVYLKRPDLALGHFETLYNGVSSPISKSRGAFWSGEAATAQGNLEEARRWFNLAARFPTAFYGQLAAQRTGQEIAVKLPPLPLIDGATEKEYLARDIVQATKILGEVDQPRLQQVFVARLRQEARTMQDFHLLTSLANAAGRQDLAIRAAKAARRSGFDLGPLLYPSRPLPAGAGPETALVLALIRQESEFYPKARSSVGALGLMQLMPRTARQTARGSGLPYDRNRLTSDANYNLRLGQAYLSELLEQFDGSYILALAAYNAGPARAKRWIKEYGDPRIEAVDPVLWIERIPFDETRNYVQRILETMEVYRGAQPGADVPWSLRVPPLGS